MEEEKEGLHPVVKVIILLAIFIVLFTIGFIVLSGQLPTKPDFSNLTEPHMHP